MHTSTYSSFNLTAKKTEHESIHLISFLLIRDALLYHSWQFSILLSSSSCQSEHCLQTCCQSKFPRSPKVVRWNVGSVGILTGSDMPSFICSAVPSGAVSKRVGSNDRCTFQTLFFKIDTAVFYFFIFIFFPLPTQPAGPPSLLIKINRPAHAVEPAMI